MHLGELEVVSGIIVERDDARKRVSNLQDLCNRLETRAESAENARAADKVQIGELLSEKSALTGRVIELQEFCTEAGVLITARKHRRKK